MAWIPEVLLVTPELTVLVPFGSLFSISEIWAPWSRSWIRTVGLRFAEVLKNARNQRCGNRTESTDKISAMSSSETLVPFRYLPSAVRHMMFPQLISRWRTSRSHISWWATKDEKAISRGSEQDPLTHNELEKHLEKLEHGWALAERSSNATQNETGSDTASVERVRFRFVFFKTGESRHAVGTMCHPVELTLRETGIVLEWAVLDDEWLSIQIVRLPAEEDGSDAARGWWGVERIHDILGITEIYGPGAVTGRIAKRSVSVLLHVIYAGNIWVKNWFPREFTPVAVPDRGGSRGAPLR
jgi:hypothetical protein